MSLKEEGFEAVIQYRTKINGATWNPLAAFDIKEAAIDYLESFKSDSSNFWEYRIINTSTGEEVEK